MMIFPPSYRKGPPEPPEWFGDGPDCDCIHCGEKPGECICWDPADGPMGDGNWYP